MGTKANVSVGKPQVTGAVYFAAGSVSVPTSTSGALTGFTNLGYVSEDGIKNDNSPSVETIKDWSGEGVLVVSGDREDTFTMKLIESLNEEVLKAVYGADNVSTSDGETTITVNNDDPVAGAWVIDMILTGGKAKRICIPSAVVSAIGEIVYKADEAIGYEITLTCTADASGNTHYEYIK